MQMRTLKYTFWQDGEFFLGYLNDFPDYQTQAYTKDELIDNLKDLLSDIESGEVPYIRKVEELAIAS
jgi:predicted RNase H-like HicB family nuclease